MFVGRKAELQQLNTLYRQDKFQCIIIYGRRRVGKTTLINEFIKDKDVIYFTAIESTAKDNLENFSKSITALDNANTDNAPLYKDFRSALIEIGELAQNRKIILVIDEYPYLARSYRPISSLLQELIDTRFKNNANLFIILCGSSMSFMEKQVLGYQSPLYGRRTAQLHIKPFTFYEAAAYYKNFSSEDLAVVYGITGGIPLYMSFITDSLSLKDNIINTFLTPSGYMYEEPFNLLNQELREPAMYNAIIRAIATGSSRISEIASKVGIENSTATNYVDKLAELSIIEKEIPAGTAGKSRKSIYSIKDGMFRFWYKFIPDNNILIQRNMPEAAWANIQPHVNEYMGKVFESICADYLLENYINLPVQFQNLGRWWGNNPKLKRQEEIDIVAAGNDKAIICECKWRNEQTDKDVLETLLERRKLLSWFSECYYYIFSKSGFTAACQQFAKADARIKLVSYSDMLKI
ncbi:MAG: ATP-binding protein [Phascolarctobacterium sp.]|uniref:ATP-binding protein n=1 Tax=Phascolarctobacterium sp. TaxID=2049039 RepID=UPI0026DC2C55|nr:ATP-binding protein [Phascolarctobacterium sp.]MDO4921195.1 ATP-binding protein [Phascolarctobacterium sp.]